jgi:hypothetical protein
MDRSPAMSLHFQDIFIAMTRLKYEIQKSQSRWAANL